MHVLALVVVVLLAASYIIWFTWKLRSGVRRAMQDLPPANQLSWRFKRNNALVRRISSSAEIEQAAPIIDATFSDPDNSSATKKQSGTRAELKDPVTWAAAADGAVAGWSILESALKIDPQVLSAIEFSTSDHLHNLADIDSYVHAHFFSSPLESADGWFNRLTGYVAEQKAASFFESTGHNVVFAPVANQPVWDMLVDGHPVQIKEHLAGAKDFAAAHPDIPVFTNFHDAALVHADSVHGLSVLDKDSVHAATTTTLDGVDGTFDPGFHFPIITLGFSVYREAKLLFAEHTTFDRALVNVGMDVAGVGGGALLGGKLGALIGSIIPGPGTVIGGILGSIVGGISGKMASSGIRKVPFYSAREQYNNAIKTARSEIDTAVYGSRQRVRDLEREYQEKFQTYRWQIETQAKEQICALRSEFDAEMLKFLESFPQFLQELSSQLKVEEQKILTEISSAGLFDRLLVRDAYVQRNAIRTWFRRARKIVKSQARAFRKIELRDVESLQKEFRRILEEFVFELQSFEQQMSDLDAQFERKRRTAEEIGKDAALKVEQHRQSLISDFGRRVVALHEQIVKKIENWNMRIGYQRDELRRQAAAVGITI